MEHYNPILGSETSGRKFITCGEIMLRLARPTTKRSHGFQLRGQLRRQRGPHPLAL